MLKKICRKLKGSMWKIWKKNVLRKFEINLKFYGNLRKVREKLKEWYGKYKKNSWEKCGKFVVVLEK